MNQRDPREKNRPFDHSSVATFLSAYRKALQEALEAVNSDVIQKVVQRALHTAKAGGDIYIAGNGAAAAVAIHACCDWTKGTHQEGLPPLRTRSLVAETSLFTALANDLGYETVFASQVEQFGRTGDLLFCLSASGNSPNLLAAAQKAKEMKISTVAFTGFDGGGLGSMCDLHVHIPYDNYGIVEDCFQTLMHAMAQYIWAKRKVQA